MSTKNLLTKEMRSEWHPKNPDWMAARLLKWQRVENYINCTSWFTKAEFKRTQEYFFTGKLTLVDDDELSVDLLLQLGWHPSNDPEVWRKQFDHVVSQLADWIVKEEIYNAISRMDSKFELTFVGFNPEIADPSFFMGREPELFNFFYRKPMPDVLEAEYVKRRYSLCQDVYFTFQSDVYNLPAHIVEGLFYTHGVKQQGLPYLSGMLTEDKYSWIFSHSSDITRTRLSLRDPIIFAQRVLKGESQVSPDDFQRILLWCEQFSQGSPSWQALWQEAERDPVTLREWDAQQEAANPEEEPEPKPKEPWPEELVALLSQLAALGYTCPEDTDRDLCSVLRALPGSAEVGFGTFVYDEYTDDDLEEPYEYFAAPLEQLCELAKLRFSYKTRRGFAEFYADDNRVGRVQLIDPAERYTANYYRDIVRLAEQHFPEQVFCFGEDFFMLYILPKPVIAVLQAAGFESKRDYFG